VLPAPYLGARPCWKLLHHHPTDEVILTPFIFSDKDLYTLYEQFEKVYPKFGGF
jgi:hypothetical protein